MLSISVIIPTFNRLATLKRAVASVLGQTHLPLELIIVDDGSTDGTDQWIKKLNAHIRYTWTENRGVSAARNLGVYQSQGEWLAFLDSDDEWHPEKLAEQAKLACSSKAQPLIHTNETWIRNGQPLKQLAKHKKSGGRIFKECLPLCCISPSTAMIHRDVFGEVGLFREDFPVCEDYDLWLRICARYETAFIDKPLITKYGGHEDQLSRKYFAMDYWRLRALENIMDSPHLTTDERQATWQVYQKKHNILHKGFRKHSTGGCHLL